MNTPQQPSLAGVAWHEKLNEGKTKVVYQDPRDPTGVIVVSKDDITAGDGKKHDVIAGKAALSNRTNANVMRLLKECGLPVAFREQIDGTTFAAARTDMILLEVVTRREAHGSYLVRFPYLKKGTVFPKLVFEVFLKTKDKDWQGTKLPCDDPHAIYLPHRGGFELYDVKKPFHGQAPFHFVPGAELREDTDWRELLGRIEAIARKASLIIEQAWRLQGRKWVDMKIELGFAPDGTLVIADVIDNDSWRILKDGKYEDKQVYRDLAAGADLNEVTQNYARVTGLSDRFGLPNQRIILWRGSDSDKVTDVAEALEKYSGGLAGALPDPGQTNFKLVPMHIVTCSMHKMAEAGLLELRKLEQEVPDAVIIALIGRSNGAGPTLSAHTTTPVINVLASFKDLPESVWSNVDMPSEVPCVTALRPGEAALAALNILAPRNPALYAALRGRIEKRFVNTIPLF